MATNYQRGRAFEYRARNKLLEKGACYVMRAAQSKGAADLIALWPHFLEANSGPLGDANDWIPRLAPPWLVQCKRGVGRITPAERDVLLQLSEETGAIPVQALSGPKGRGVVFTDLRTQEVL